MSIELDAIRAELRAARSAFDRADRILDALAAAAQAELPGPSEGPVPDHRRMHRPGRAPILDCDPELRAFVEARIGRMTFEGIAGDVREAFPNGRRVGRSAIHTWAKRQGLIRR